MGMQWETVQVDGRSGVQAFVHVGTGIIEPPPEPPIGLPVQESLRGLFSTFKSANRTSAGTTIITSPIGGGSLVMVDLLISTDRVANSAVTVQFEDGTNTVIIFNASTVDAPVALAVPLSGRWQGWTDARLEMVTTGNVDATVAVSYLKLNASLPFAEWDSFR